MKLEHHGSIDIERSPEQVWDLVSDVTRTGEWSPVCRACEWDVPAAGPHIGAGFVGHNSIPGRDWSTHSEVVLCDRGHAFGWDVNGGWAHWRYTMEPTATGTRLTESWEFREAGQEGFRERFGDDAAAQIELRRIAAHAGIPVTLAALKRIAES